MKVFHLKWMDGSTTDIHGTDILDAILHLQDGDIKKELDSWEEKKEDAVKEEQPNA